MKSDDLFDAIGNVDDDMILNAQSVSQKKVFYKKTAWISAIAAIFVISGMLGGFLLLGSQKDIPQVPTTTASETSITNSAETSKTILTESPTTTPTPLIAIPPETTGVNYLAHALATALYPDEVLYPSDDLGFADYDKQHTAWSEHGTIKNQAYTELDVDIEAFLYASIGEILSHKDGENIVFSPLNVYMAFAMLAEITDNNSRQQILDVLGCDNIETLRKEASALWLSNYSDDGLVTSILSSSVWLSDRYSYKQESLQQLANIYYASSFSGKMGSEKYNKALQTWLNDQTGGLLKDSAETIEMGPATIMALATTIYFKASWSDFFSKENNHEGIFHAANGDVVCEFMNQSIRANCYYGEKFIAVPKALGLEYQGTMWLILPNEGISPEDLLTDEEAMFFLTTNQKQKKTKDTIVKLSLPKFDISSKLDLRDSMKNLGITDVFDSILSDFSPMTNDRNDIIVASADHSARVTINEEGCTAATFSDVMTTPDSFTPLEINFTLDRPFLFVITSDVGLPLFVGTVNQPN